VYLANQDREITVCDTTTYGRIFAGARTDGDVDAAKERACEIADAINADWARVKPDAVYFKCFHDLSLFRSYARISLFPFID
jgi:hypothetical protein